MGRPRWFIWAFSIVLHVELAVIAGALLGGEPEDLPSDRPDLHCVLTRPAPSRIPVEIPTDRMFGRWPIPCDHRFIPEMSEDRLGDGLRCGGCGWPWWVIRARSQQ